MKQRIQNGFISVTAVILFIAAAAKLLSARGAAQALSTPDPLLLLSHRHVFYIVAALELALSAYLVLGRRANLKLALILWMGINCVLYRAGLAWMHGADYCNCLGNLGGLVSISPRALSALASAALGWMLVGSAALLVIRSTKPEEEHHRGAEAQRSALIAKC